MKPLIAIGSWENAARLGYNQAQRDTWLKELVDADYKFFVGDNTSTGENEEALIASYEVCLRCHGDRYKYVNVPEPFVPQEDEVVLSHLPDDHLHNSFKTKRALQWALQQGYKYVFICGVDTLVSPTRLLDSGFEKHHYTGTDQWNPCFAGGGPGYWLDAEAAEHVARSDVRQPNKQFQNCDLIWAEDTWVGGILGDAGIALHPDRRYKEWPLIPLSSNDWITSHLGVPTTEEPVYKAQRMLDMHTKSKE